MGRFLNADALASTGQGILGCNMFAYCNNTPVSYADRGGTRRERVDEFQDDWEPIGAGFQLDFSASLGELSGSLGVEIVIYWDTPEAKEKGEPVVAVYAYGGGSFDFSLFAEDITTLTNLLIGSADLIKSDGTTALEAVLSTSKHSLSGAISLSGFLVFGNNKFENASHYTEGFETFSAGYGKARVSYAWSDCCKTVGVGVSFLGGSTGLCITRGKSYYWMLYSN